MPKRTKKTEPKPTPPADLRVTSRSELPPMTMTELAVRGLDAVCPICGTIRAADVCPVDGHRFEEN